MNTNPDEPIGVTFSENGGVGQYSGLTKREYIAIEMCKAILSNEELRMKIREDRRHHAYVAIEFTDQLIEHLNKSKTDE